jgi:Holliday junction resolvase RusA-like endonuclease
MSDKHEINLIIGASKILSVNALYSSKLVYKMGKPISTIYKSGEAKRAEKYIKDQVRALNIPVNFPWVNDKTLFSYSINVIFRSGFLLRDLDNTLKLVQDGIFRALDLNDSHVVRIYAQKSYCPGINEEKICISLKEFNNEKELCTSYIPHPEIIWTDFVDKDKLGIKELKQKKYKNTLYLTNDKNIADTKLFIISPETDIDYNTFGNIIEETSNNIFQSSGLVYIAILGNSETWHEDKWQGISEFSKKIEKINKESYSGIRLKFVQNLEEVRNWLSE